MDEIGVGVIGCGNISEAYLTLAPLFAGFRILAVADVDLAAAEARGAAHGVQVVSVQDLLADPKIAVVVNLTVPAAHFEVTKAILDAGKHVYSEKPLVLTLDDARVLDALANESGLRIGAAPDTFLGSSHQMARAMLDAGEIGPVVSATTYLMSPGMEQWHPNPGPFYKQGAGPVLDVGPYAITNLLQLLGPVQRVGALAAVGRAERVITSEPLKGERIAVETPTTVHALMEFVSGAVVTLGASWDVTAHLHGAMELYGTDGALFLPDPNYFGGSLFFSVPGVNLREVQEWDHPLGQPNFPPEEPEQANYRGAGLAEMVAAIREDRPHRCAFDLCVHAVDVMTSILRAAEEGQFVNLVTHCARPDVLGPDAAKALLR